MNAKLSQKVFALPSTTKDFYILKEYVSFKQCDQIVAETPNRDVWGVQMSLIFRKCRLAFFVTFKPKMAFFLAFLIFGRFYPIFASFLKKIIYFPTKFSLWGITFYISTRIWFFAQVFWLFFHKKAYHLKQCFIDFIPFLMLGVFEDHCRLKKSF